MLEEQDTCRICSAPAEPGQPLFHPCKCSGTIRYIHQDCLTTWLEHSKKKTCDVCKHQYSFSKVYAQDMPTHLPVILLFRQFAQQAVHAVIFCLRAVLVAFVWLAVLPWFTVWTWRIYFAMGSSTAWWISARPRPDQPQSRSNVMTTALLRLFSFNTTIQSSTNSTYLLPDYASTDSSPANNNHTPSIMETITSDNFLRVISKDIFTGQIIATVVVLVFISVFLLREWISQNARPGVFEDVDPPVEVVEGVEEGEGDGEVELEGEVDGEVEGEPQVEQEQDVVQELELELDQDQDQETEQIEEEAGPLVRFEPDVDLDAVIEFMRGAPTVPRHPDRPMRGLPFRQQTREDPNPDPSTSTAAAAPTGSTNGPDPLKPRHRPGSKASKHSNPEAFTAAMNEWIEQNKEIRRAKKARETDPTVPFTDRERASDYLAAKFPVMTLKTNPEVRAAYDGETATMERMTMEEKLEHISTWTNYQEDPSKYREPTLPSTSTAASPSTSASNDFFATPPNGAAAARKALPTSPLPYPLIASTPSSSSSTLALPQQLQTQTPSSSSPLVTSPPVLPSAFSLSRSSSSPELTSSSFFSTPSSSSPTPSSSSPQQSQAPQPVPNGTSTLNPTPKPSHSQTPPLLPRPTGMTIPVPRRPPMPYATLPTPTTPPIGPGVMRVPAIGASGNDNTPLGSPSLATYRPPEEFKDDDVEEGSALSSASRSGPGYFDGVEDAEVDEKGQGVDKGKGKGKDVEEEKGKGKGKERAEEGEEEGEKMRREHARYFREVEAQGEGEKRTNGESTWVWSDEGFTPNAGSVPGVRLEDVVVDDGGPVRIGGTARNHRGGDEGPPPLIFVPSDSEEDDEEDEDGAVRGLEPIADAPVFWARPQGGQLVPIRDRQEVIGVGERRAFAPGRERAAFVPGGRLHQLGVGIPPGGDGRLGNAGFAPILPAEVPEAVGEGEQGLQPEFMDDEFAGEDDMEGAFEAIGMRGPLHAVAQNAALMVFVLDTAIGLGVWVPYTLGKSAALLALDPKRALHILHWPIRVMRIITDPITDSVLYILNKLFFPIIFRAVRYVLYAVIWSIITLVNAAAGPEPVDKLTEYVGAVHERVVNQPWDQPLTIWQAFSNSTAQVDIDTSAKIHTPPIIERILESDHPAVRFAEPYLALLGQKVRIKSEELTEASVEYFEEFKEIWTKYALGDGNAEKIFAVCLGYTVVALALAIYLNVLTVGSVRNAGRAVRSAVRQQLLVVKVAVFIIIELVIFPLGCGINLDLCSIWLFPEATLQSRLVFFQYAPLTATFYHWVLGTMFMYQFAILLAGCRTIMRPGAMWFIKDPSDQNFHPIRDILERPAWVQLKKLSASALMYGLVVAGGVGSVGALFWAAGILPLRWKPREPLSEVPIDLILLQTILPYTMKYFRPKKFIRRHSINIWKFLCAELRLSSYMFGERHPEEEFTPKQWRFFSWRDAGIKLADDEQPLDGTYRRVPATDNVAIARDMRVTAQVNMNGEAIDEEAQRQIDAQNAEAIKQKRVPKDDYTVVYIPPHFPYRVVGFILALWTVGSLFIAGTVAMPISLGRQIFRLLVDKEVHDGYSFILGFYGLWASLYVGQIIDRMERRRQRWTTSTSGSPVTVNRAAWPLYVVKRSLVWAAKTSYMVAVLGVVVPVLVAMVVEVYVVLPIRFILEPELVPRVKVVQMWALGILYVKIGLRAQRRQPANRLTTGLREIRQHGWMDPHPLRATRDVIVPVLSGLIGMLVIPPVTLYLVQRAFKFTLDDRFILLHVYPSIFTAVGVSQMIWFLGGFLKTWSQSIRDKEFLVELQLKNYEAKKKASSAKERELYILTRQAKIRAQRAAAAAAANGLIRPERGVGIADAVVIQPGNGAGHGKDPQRRMGRSRAHTITSTVTAGAGPSTSVADGPSAEVPNAVADVGRAAEEGEGAGGSAIEEEREPPPMGMSPDVGTIEVNVAKEVEVVIEDHPMEEFGGEEYDDDLDPIWNPV